jgi:ketosteroid isomerase-like protein
MAIRETTYIAQNIHPLWTDREFDRILSEMINEDVEWTTVPTGETFRGHEGFRQFMEGWSDAFPDGRAEDTNVYVGEDFAVTEFVGRGTHTGTLRTPSGEIPPTERSVEWPLCEVYQIRDGKIVRGRTYFDAATLMDELGFTLTLEQQPRAEEEASPRAAEVPPKTAEEVPPAGQEARQPERQPEREPERGREEDKGFLDRAKEEIREEVLGQEEPRREEAERRDEPPRGDEPRTWR